MMKKLSVTFEGVTDTTGYLHTLVKCLVAALQCGGYEDRAEDAAAASGFAFRMWADEKTLCPSAMSIWEFKQQKTWVENAGLVCDYTERLWGQDQVQEERRLAAIEIIRKSIDAGTAAVVWDLGDCEWGLVIGYDEEKQEFLTMKATDGGESLLSYEKLGMCEIPILSVLTVTGRREKTKAQLVADTKQLAVSHLKGEEWCDNACGLAAYDAIIHYMEEHSLEDGCWSLEYYLGTYAALKWYVWKFFEKYGEIVLSGLYQEIYECWKQAFDLKVSRDVSLPQVKAQIAELLEQAGACEVQAVKVMED